VEERGRKDNFVWMHVTHLHLWASQMLLEEETTGASGPAVVSLGFGFGEKQFL
jgi:hypothetical protein